LFHSQKYLQTRKKAKRKPIESDKKAYPLILVQRKYSLPKSNHFKLVFRGSCILKDL